MKILFLDFDGPMIPTRAHFLPGQNPAYPTIFDPVAVALVNRLCDLTGAKIVVQSFWRRIVDHGVTDIPAHMIAQGIKAEHIHPDWACPWKLSSTRWSDIGFWLSDHEDDEIEAFVIIDDEEASFRLFDRAVKIEYNTGIDIAAYLKAMHILQGRDPVFFVEHAKIQTGIVLD